MNVRFLLLSQIPSLDDITLRLIDIFLVLDLLDADLDAILCEDDVFLAHALRGLFRHLGGGEVDLVEDPADAAYDGEGDDEGEELPVSVSWVVS